MARNWVGGWLGRLVGRWLGSTVPYVPPVSIEGMEFITLSSPATTEVVLSSQATTEVVLSSPAIGY